MTPTRAMRIGYREFEPGMRAMNALHRAVANSGLEPTLVELVRTRASQINGCAYCIDVHTKDALAAGETVQRLLALSAWEETPFYSDRERAALKLTEAVTRLTQHAVADELVEECEQFFSDVELAALLYAIVEINSWNRLAVAGRPPIGQYETAPATAAEP